MTDIHEILAERGRRYGSFEGHAQVSQTLKKYISLAITIRGTELADDQREALSMICHKIARIINGDPDYIDSWQDIVGYAQLVVDRLSADAVANSPSVD